MEHLIVPNSESTLSGISETPDPSTAKGLASSNFRVTSTSPGSAKRRRLVVGAVRDQLAELRRNKDELINTASEFMREAQASLEQLMEIEHQLLIQRTQKLWKELDAEFSQNFLVKVQDTSTTKAMDSTLNEWTNRENIIRQEMHRLQRLLAGEFDDKEEQDVACEDHAEAQEEIIP